MGLTACHDTQPPLATNTTPANKAASVPRELTGEFDIVLVKRQSWWILVRRLAFALLCGNDENVSLVAKKPPTASTAVTRA